MPDELSQEEIDALLSEGAKEGDKKEDKGVLNEDELEALLSAAKEEGKEEEKPPEKKMELPSFDKAEVEKKTDEHDIEDLLQDVELNVKIELGRCIMPIEKILKLSEGSVVELDKLAGDPVDILINERLVAKGEVLVLNDAFCVRITEIISPKERLARKM